MTCRHNGCARIAPQMILKAHSRRSNHGVRTFLFTLSRVFMSIIFLLAALGHCHPAQAQIERDYTYNPNHYDAVKVIQAMKTPHSDLMVVSAHRGLHSVPGDNTAVPGLPENSLAAVGGAALEGLEVLELDIKQTPDGQLTFSHDKTWGRQAVPANHSTAFNPFADPAQQTAVNPTLADTAMTTLQANWVLRDSVTLLFPSNPEPPPTLQQVIAYYNGHQIGTVLAFDVKDTDTFKKAWAVIAAATDFLGRPFYADVIWKVGGNNYKNPAALKADFPNDYQNINYWPVYNTSDIAPVTQVAVIPPPDDVSTAATAPTSFGSEQAIIDSLDSFYSDSSIHTISAEITQKEPNGILGTMRTHNISNGRSVAEFSATGDYFAPGDPTARFFNSKDGSCCQTLDQFYYNGAPHGQPSDTSDQRGDLNFVVNQNFNIITADTAASWKDQLYALGLRNLSYMQEDSYLGDPHCNAGAGQYPGCDANSTTVYTYCVAENGICSFPGQRVVAFGANGSYNYFTVNNKVSCNNDVLGPDPIGSVAKACYYGPAIGSPLGQFGQPSVYCADESGICHFNASAIGIFGVGSTYSSTPGFQGSFNCNRGSFGNADPASGLVRTCFYQLSSSSNLWTGPAGYVGCAAEGQTCTFVGAARIAFGANGKFNYRTFPVSSAESAAGGAPCTTGEFKDPIDGVVKACYYQYALPYGSNSQLGTGSGGGLTSTGGKFSGPGEPNGSIPPLNPQTADTFTVNAGGTSFTVSQPNDSVATYTWTNGGAPSEVLTSASGSGLGYALSNVSIGTYSGAVPSDSITVDPNTTYQTIDGFGGAMTDSAASLILGSANSSQIMQTLFGTSAGQAGLTIVRSPMGSSDMMAVSNDIHTYEDTQGSFSVSGYASDQRQITALQKAKAIAGSNFKILGTPWSAPGWAKNDGSLLPPQCGTNQNEISSSEFTQYAAYFTRYVNAYAAVGLQPWAVSLQNEPENCKTAMPTTQMSATDEVALAKALKSQLPSGTKVLGWDHNWNDPGFVDVLTASGSVDAIGYHCYDGTHYINQTTAVATYMTECSGFTASSANVAENLGWEVANLLIGPLRYGSRGSLYWTLAQDPNGNPHLGGSDACQDCRGMVTINSDGSFEPSQDLYYWAQFSKFVPPGSVRIASNNSGNLSTVAFQNGNQITLVVLNSASTQANGGVAGSDERNLRRHIVQWNGDTAAQKTAWLVGSDGYRRWISDGGTYNCLVYDAGMMGPDVEASGALDRYINLQNVWAVCGQVTMGTDSELEVGTYLKSTNGARLTLTSGGLTAVDASGTSQWAPSGAGADRLILQEDGNLVLYQGTTIVWASNTVGSGAIWLSMRDDGSFALFNKANQEVWVSQINPNNYKGKIVEWDGDTATQKTSWLVGADGNRRWIPDLATFNCLHAAGYGNALSLSTEVLSEIPNLSNVWAACGNTDHLGPNGALEQGANLISGNYYLGLTSTNLVLLQNGNKIWDTGHGGAELRVQSDGNVVIYDASGNATWSTGTNRSNPGNWILGNDGSLRLWDGNNNNIWSRNSSEVPVGPPGYFYCANENSQCNFQGYGAVIFGGVEPSNYSGQIIFHNGTSCSNTSFPQDPDPGVAKKCWYLITVPPQ
jgi:O-glycosyl hydrolase/glycerophosphoryl diester phosphodiesterase